MIFGPLIENMVMKAKISDREWYQAYCAAMLETDVEKIVDCVESARQAIQKRIKELNVGRPMNKLESVELDRALRFLNMVEALSKTSEGPFITQILDMVNLPIWRGPPTLTT